MKNIIFALVAILFCSFFCYLYLDLLTQKRTLIREKTTITAERDSLKKIVDLKDKEIKIFKSKLVPQVGVSIMSFSNSDVQAETRWYTSDSTYLPVDTVWFKFLKSSKVNRIGSEYILYRMFP